MNRIDRLTAIILFLQNGKRTANEIAQRFEVSRRTILRDIEALSEMGVPIVTEIGVNGGYSLMPDYKLPALALNVHEALILRLALQHLRTYDHLPFRKESETLLLKIESLIPGQKKAEVDQLDGVVSVLSPQYNYPTPFLDLLIESALSEQWLKVRYRSVKGWIEQTILPQRVRAENGLWYCDAFSFERNEQRVYRVDRFARIEQIEQPSSVDTSKKPLPCGHPSFPEVVIEFTVHGSVMMERYPRLGPMVHHREDGTGWLRERLRPQDYDWLVRVLMSLGQEARVVEPPVLLEKLYREIQNVQDHYFSESL